MKKTIHALLPYIILTICLLFALWPLFGAGYFVTDDGEWMVIRLSAFYQSLREGQFPVRFLGRLNHSYGYPVANFLYPGFLYIGSFLHILGLSFLDSVKAIFVGSVVGGSVILYITLRRYFGKLSSFVGSVSFIAAPYLLFDIYKRGSLGEVLAMCVATLGIFAIVANARWLFAAAIALLIVSHNSLALIMLMLLGAAVKAHGRKGFFLPLLFGFAMTAFFWFPAIFEKKNVIFDTIAVSNPFSYFATGDSAYLLNPVAIFAGLLIWFLKRKKTDSAPIRLYAFATLVSALLAMPLTGMLWSVPSMAQLVQFPYRLLAVGVVTGPWVIGFVVEKLRGYGRFAFLVFFSAVSILVVSSQQRNISYLNRLEGYYTTNEATTTVADEYMPIWVRVKPLNRAVSKAEVYSGKAKLQIQKNTSQIIEMTVDAAEDSIIQVNFLYYPGWNILLNGQVAPVDYGNAYGIMRVKIPSGTHRVVATFRETVPRFVADGISVITMLLYLGIVTNRTIIWLKKRSST